MCARARFGFLLHRAQNFVLNIGGCSASWSMDSFKDAAVERIRAQVGDGYVIGAVSGGVDSSVAALLLQQAIGDRFHAVLVDNGMMRKNECAKVVTRLREQCGINLTLSDASEVIFFLEILKVKKRMVLDVFQKSACNHGITP